MVGAFRRLFAPKPRLLDEARSKAQGSAPSTLIILVDASYMPHGGRDRLFVELALATPGRVERLRTPERREAERVERTLGVDEVARLRAELDRRRIWELRDEPPRVMDGLGAEFAFVEGAREHEVTLPFGTGDSELGRLLRFLLELAPLREPH